MTLLIPETVVLITNHSGKVMRVFRLPTAQLDKRSENEIIELARKAVLLVEFHPVPWSGVEAVKHEIKEMQLKEVSS